MLYPEACVAARMVQGGGHDTKPSIHVHFALARKLAQLKFANECRTCEWQSGGAEQRVNQGLRVGRAFNARKPECHLPVGPEKRLEERKTHHVIEMCVRNEQINGSRVALDKIPAEFHHATARIEYQNPVVEAQLHAACGAAVFAELAASRRKGSARAPSGDLEPFSAAGHLRFDCSQSANYPFLVFSDILRQLGDNKVALFQSSGNTLSRQGNLDKKEKCGTNGAIIRRFCWPVYYLVRIVF